MDLFCKRCEKKMLSCEKIVSCYASSCFILAAVFTSGLPFFPSLLVAVLHLAFFSPELPVCSGCDDHVSTLCCSLAV